MKNYYNTIIICLLVVFCSFNAFAQESDTEIIDIDVVEQFLQQQTAGSGMDSLSSTNVVEQSLQQTTADTTTTVITQPSLTATPEIELLDTNTIDRFISKKEAAILYRNAVKRRAHNPLFMDWVFPYNDFPDCFETKEEALRTIQKGARRYILKNAAELFTYDKNQLPKLTDFTKIEDDRSSFDGISVSNRVKIEHEPIQIKLPKLSPWQKRGRIQIQASQNYISSNWYKGGESNISILTLAYGRINYDNKKNIQWENALEMKFGFNSTGKDTLRKIRTNEDVVRLNSRLGIKAFSTWFATADLEFSTQFFNTYVSNSYERTTGPLSPIRFYGSVGLNYKYKKMLSVLIAPFSYKLTAVADTSKADGVRRSIADKLGIEKGKKASNEFGSLVKVEFNYAFTREIELESTLSLYTNYKGIEFDWEVIGNFMINRFLSARVSLRPRYDSTIKLPNNEKPKLQFKELISLGFHYNF